MRKTPSYLKGLAETRARAAGDVQRYQVLLAEIGQKLAEAKAEREACDRLIRKFDLRLNPEMIEPIRAWKGRYGKRGQLLASISRLIEAHSPEAISTTELCWELQIEFQLDFVSGAEKSRWEHNSLGRALNCLVSAGKVERLHDISNGPTWEVGRWRWKSDGALSLDHLRAQAAAAGVSVQQADDAHE